MGNAVAAKSIFSKLTVDKALAEKLNVAKVEEVFGQKNADPKVVPAMSGASSSSSDVSDKKKKKKETVVLLDGKRSMGMAIGLSQFKMSFDDLRKAILKLDAKTLSVDGATTLVDMCPTKEEVTTVTDAQADPKLLAKPEQFILAVHSIPFLKARMRDFVLKLNYDATFAVLKRDIDTVCTAVDICKQSSKLPSFLQVVLLHGNFLNGGTFRGNVAGFNVEVLTKLVDTRSFTSRGYTLLHYLFEVVEEDGATFSEAAGIAAELAPCTAAVAVALDQTVADTAKLVKQLKDICNTVKSIDSLPQKEKHDKFVKIMSPFAKVSLRESEALLEKAKNIETTFKDVANLYGCTTMSVEEWMTLISAFVGQWKQAGVDNIKRRQAEEKKRKREAQLVAEKKLKEEAAARRAARRASATHGDSLGLGPDGTAGGAGDGDGEDGDGNEGGALASLVGEVGKRKKKRVRRGNTVRKRRDGTIGKVAHVDEEEHGSPRMEHRHSMVGKRRGTLRGMTLQDLQAQLAESVAMLAGSR